MASMANESMVMRIPASPDAESRCLLICGAERCSFPSDHQGECSFDRCSGGPTLADIRAVSVAFECCMPKLQAAATGANKLLTPDEAAKDFLKLWKKHNLPTQKGPDLDAVMDELFGNWPPSTL